MPTVLIVEDVQTDREIYSNCLKDTDWQVLTVETGEEALERLKVNTPDAIVLDVVLPGLSGFEICRNIKNNAHTKNIPVVICSTKKTDMDRFWGLKQGADFYLAKPVNRQELISTLQKLV
jgi:chemotaxis family two-component system response regulator PixH